LSTEVLDAIDDIVAPGTELNPADNYYAAAPWLEAKGRRR
jgi:hypothetical protein